MISELGQLNWDTITKAATVAAGTAQVVAAGDNALATAIKSVSFRTRYSPEKTYTGQQLQEMYRDPTPNPYLKFLQPVVTLDTILGKQIIAPYGEPSPTEWKKNTQELAVTALAVGGTVAGGILLLGILLGRRR